MNGSLAQHIAFKLPGYYGHFEMGLRTRWHVMHIALVDNLEMQRL